MENLKNQTVNELLRLHSDIVDELREREVVRSANSPAGDYAEYLFARAFGWSLESNSKAAYDAVDENKVRYQIKCSRLTARNTSRQMGGLRNLSANSFDVLAAVLLDKNYLVYRAALIPVDTVINESKYTNHVNAHRFILRDQVWRIPGVQDVTEILVQFQN